MQWQRFTPARAAEQCGLASLLPTVWPLVVLAAPNDFAAMPQVGVLVRNLSHAPTESIQKAEGECQQMFRAAGILIIWINAFEDVDWKAPDVVLQVAILARAPKSRDISSFGSAFPEKQNGAQVFIYYDRLSDLSRST